MPRSFSSWASDHRAPQTHFIAYAFFEMHVNQKNNKITFSFPILCYSKDLYLQTNWEEIQHKHTQAL